MHQFIRLCHCCCRHYPPPGDMIGHHPYHTWHVYYYFRPYQADQARSLNEQTLNTGSHGFSNAVFHQLHKAHAEQWENSKALEFANAGADVYLENRSDRGATRSQQGYDRKPIEATRLLDQLYGGVEDPFQDDR